MKSSLQVEVLYFKGCPNHGPAVEQVRQALKAEDAAASISEIEVEDAAMAQETGFLGSPTVRVNGVDVEESARGAQGVGFGCRTYLDDGRRTGLPSVAVIRKALAEASAPRSGAQGGNA